MTDYARVSAIDQIVECAAAVARVSAIDLLVECAIRDYAQVSAIALLVECAIAQPTPLAYRPATLAGGF